MAMLKAAQRRSMPKKDFAGPGKSFPINDATHARMAISGATRSEHAGNISAGQADAIKSKARGKLKGGASGSKMKASPSGKSGGFDYHDSMSDHLDPDKKC